MCLLFCIFSVFIREGKIIQRAKTTFSSVFFAIAEKMGKNSKKSAGIRKSRRSFLTLFHYIFTNPA
jgi:hypothetical protein